MKVSKILIISIYSFPNGMAATNRMRAYAKAISLLGVNVEIVIPFPTDSCAVKELPNSDIVEGIYYNYSTGRYKSKIKIFRALSHFSGYRKMCGVICSMKYIIKHHNFDAIIISTDGLQNLFCYSLLAKKLKMKSIFIFDEYPIPIRHQLKSKIPCWKEIMYKYVLKNIDGYISISDKLCAYYNNFVNKPSMKLPILIDTTRFSQNKKNSSDQYLCYMGNMELAKDNVDLIIKAFILIANNHPDLKLYLYGSPNSVDRIKLEKLIFSSEFSNRIVLKGRVENLDVPVILFNARVLLSSQPMTVRAAGGFPTKLGEYLCAGIPTLITDVGENSKYVHNEYHCYFVQPNNVKLYAEKLDHILNNYQEASKVAQQGKKMVEDNFSHITWGKKIIDFISNLN